MKEKKTWIFIGLIFCLLLVAVTGIVLIKNAKIHQSEPVYAYEQTKIYDNNGMYYFRAGYLMFMDNVTGDSVPLCAKANCGHNSSECDACYLNSYGHDILLYDDMVYVSYFTIEYYTDSAGDEQSATTVKVECCKRDGSGRKQIYESDTGAVLSMLALDGRLYYTTYETQPGTEDMENYYMSDCYLYCYDMDWGITKELLAYQGDDLHYNASLRLAPGTDKEQLYLLYEYEREDNVEYVTEWLTLDRKGRVLEEEMLPVNVSISSMAWLGDDVRITYKEDIYQSDSKVMCVWKQDGTREQIFSTSGECSLSYTKNGYFYCIYDETVKLLMDYEEHKYYIAKSAVSDFYIVPDIHLIDKENDIIYYDTVDYTGVAVGSLFTEDPTSLSCMKWSEFLEEYFVEYEGQEIEGLTIGDLD